LSYVVFHEPGSAPPVAVHAVAPVPSERPQNPTPPGHGCGTGQLMLTLTFIESLFIPQKVGMFDTDVKVHPLVVITSVGMFTQPEAYGGQLHLSRCIEPGAPLELDEPVQFTPVSPGQEAVIVPPGQFPCAIVIPTSTDMHCGIL